MFVDLKYSAPHFLAAAEKHGITYGDVKMFEQPLNGFRKNDVVAVIYNREHKDGIKIRLKDIDLPDDIAKIVSRVKNVRAGNKPSHCLKCGHDKTFRENSVRWCMKCGSRVSAYPKNWNKPNAGTIGGYMTE